MKNILSIQSHVVFGHAGNEAAVFPMRRLGVEVWPLHAVQFSNHTQYAEGWKGIVLPPGHLVNVVEGIQAIGKLPLCDAVLTGYIGSAAQGEAILAIVEMVKAANPRAWFFCDPVMGHPAKGCKVAPGVAEFHRDFSVKVADMMSPNVLELGKLVDRDLENVEDCVKAAREICEKGPRLILVKHLSYAARGRDTYEMLLVTPEVAWHVERPLIEFTRQPVGVGDLISGIFLSRLLMGDSHREALEFTNASVYEVMLATKEAGEFELQLVAAQERLARPGQIFKAEEC